MTTVTHTDILNHANFHAHLGHYAAKALVALPDAGARIEKAVALVMNGCVEHNAGPRWTVASATSHNERWYDVAENVCNCPNYERYATHTNRYACKHVISVWLYRRAVQAIEKEDVMSTPLHDDDDARCWMCPEPLQYPQQDFTPAEILPQAEKTTGASVSGLSVPLPEAAASANAFVLVNGHRLQITLRDHDEHRLMQRMIALLADYAPAPGK